MLAENILFLVPQMQLAYIIEGDGTAPQYFGIDNTTGRIFLKRSFTDDPLKTPTYTVSLK